MFLRLVVILFGSWTCAARRAGAARRVYRGDTATVYNFPYIVMMQQQAAPFLRHGTGSLIAETWVLTAAHCFFYVDEPQKRLIVRFGDFDLHAGDTELYSKIKSTFVPTRVLTTHQQWLNQMQRSVRDDIGLVLIERIPNKPTAKLLALDYRTLFGLPVKYAGFGFTDSSKSVLKPRPMKYLPQLQSMPLQVGEGVLLPCDNFRNFGPVICVEPKCSNREQGARSGDSGGPLVYDGRIIGVTKGPASIELVTGGTFTPVSIYLGWIKKVMSSNGNASQFRIINFINHKNRFKIVNYNNKPNKNIWIQNV